MTVRVSALLWTMLSTTLAAAGPSDNLARTATRVAASHSVPEYSLQQAADGSIDTFWWESREQVDGGWAEFEWSAPVTIREVVARQVASSRQTGLTQLAIQIWREGSWTTVSESGDGGKALPVYLLVEFAPQSTTRLRVANLRGNVLIREIEIYEGPNPPHIDVRGDAAGNMIGVLCDAWGTAGIGGVEVDVTATVRGRPWSARTTTATTGEFETALPVGLSGPVHVTARTRSRTVSKVVDAGDLHQGLVPIPQQSGTDVLLNGKWRFRTDPPEGFERASFDDSAWAEIDVPSHWILQGFLTESGIGGYRRRVQVPGEWKGERVRIAFDGVYSGAEVWVNGHRAGSHLGGANAFQLDISEFVLPGAMNTIAVKVAEHTPASDILDHMSVYADFPLAGIFRKVYLFATPALHISRIHSETRFDETYRDAVLTADVTIVNESDAPMRAATVEVKVFDGTVLAGDATLAGLSVPAWEGVRRSVEIHVRSPKRWEAEHPSLYRLQAVLNRAGKPVEVVERRIGFRDVRVRGTELLVNGVAVKLKGTCHHDSHPIMGRSVTAELEKRDLDLIKEANLNAVRTSHYPPLPELLDLADELGVYVEAEASFCWVDDSYDLRYTALAKQFTGELVERDRSHPSVILWSAGNESLWGSILLAGEGLIRRSDKTRPVVGSWMRDHFDLDVLHNPMDVPAMRERENSARPINWDESIAIFQGIWGDAREIWRDPGFRDYYVVPLREVMNEFWKSKVVAGSFIWAWSDDLFAVPGRSSEYGRDFTALHAMTSVYGLPGRGITGDAPWGVVDGWRRKKPEFWHVQKLHSPVRVETTSSPVPDAGGTVRIQVENRYNFTSLAELTIKWELDGHEGVVHSQLAPNSSGTVEIQPGFSPLPGSQMVLRFGDASGRTVETAAVRIGEKPAKRMAGQSEPLRVYEEQTLAGRMLRVVGREFEIGFDRTTGLVRRATSGRVPVLYQGAMLHIAPADPTVEEPVIAEAWKLDSPLEVERTAERVVVTARGHYPKLKGTYRTVIESSGEMSVTYDFAYSGEDLIAREVGLQFGLPLTDDTLQWERNGEWTWYPEDHIGRNQGVAKARSGHRSTVPPEWPFAQDDSPMGTNDFRSSKRNFLSASLCDAAGFGVMFSSDGSQHFRSAIESDRIAAHVNDWFGGSFSRDEWRQFGKGKPLKAGDRLQGRASFQFVAGKL